MKNKMQKFSGYGIIKAVQAMHPREKKRRIIMSIDRICINSIDQNEAEYIEIARSIWENPEIGYKEVHASGLYVETLKKHGFQVELGAHGVPTAVKAVWGKGYPAIGFCAARTFPEGRQPQGSCRSRRSWTRLRPQSSRRRLPGCCHRFKGRAAGHRKRGHHRLLRNPC